MSTPTGYVMHHRPTTLDDAVRMAHGWVNPDSLDGRVQGRLSYCFRLAEDCELGAAGTFVGTSSLGEVNLEREQLHLGWTIYAPAFWGSGTNAEAKWLLLREAFEGCGMGRVKIQTDILNTRSQAAIARLGATREGVLRRDQPREDGTWRDTVVFSILADEWPGVAAGLRERFPA
ncbi:GNAT family protein [Luteococcus sp. H138]|uniref:GNAT family N-acetyltransferase n=1 Tax=unclassified Luteococcus TaxID=2639923 RepID=UPI00313CA394